MFRAVLFAVPVFVSQCDACGRNPTSAPVDDASFVIRQGEHDSDPGGITALRTDSHPDRFVSFTASFADDADYATVTPVNQWDWNKLMGLTTAQIHEDSVRLGWRWLPDEERMELGVYAYVAGERKSEAITDVALGETFDATLRMSEDTVGATVNGQQVDFAGAGSAGIADDATWVLRTAYFGGDETAPHDIHIDVTGARTDP